MSVNVNVTFETTSLVRKLQESLMFIYANSQSISISLQLESVNKIHSSLLNLRSTETCQLKKKKEKNRKKERKAIVCTVFLQLMHQLGKRAPLPRFSNKTFLYHSMIVLSVCNYISNTKTHIVGQLHAMSDRP